MRTFLKNQKDKKIEVNSWGICSKNYNENGMIHPRITHAAADLDSLFMYSC